MSDVSCRVFTFMTEAEKAGLVRVDALLAGLPMTRQHAEDPANRMPWEVWAVVCDRFAAAVGTEDAIMEAARLALHDAVVGPVSRMASLLGSARQLYLLGLRWLAPSLYTGFRFSVEEASDGQVMVSVGIPEPLRASRAWLLMTEGMLRAGPLVFGLSGAQVQRLELTDRTARWAVAVPAERGVSANLKKVYRALRSPRTIADELIAQQQRFDELWLSTRKSLQVFRSTLDALPVLVAVYAEGAIRFANPALARLLSVPVHELIGAPLQAHAVESDRERLRALLETPSAAVSETIRFNKAGGGQLLAEVGAAGGLEFDGQPARVAYAVDVTRERESRAALERSESTIRALLQSLPDLVLRLDRDGVVLEVQAGEGIEEREQVQTMVGLKPLELAGALTHVPEYADLVQRGTQVMQQALELGEPQVFEFTAPDPRGTPRDLVARLLPSERGDEVLVVVHDDTQRRNIERRLASSDRMASLGSLAAGVAHEINGPLTALVGNLTVLKEQLTEALPADRRGEVLSLVSELEEGADRIVTTVARMRELSRAESSRHVPVDMVHVVEGALHIASAELRHKAQIAKDIRAVRKVVGDPTELGQVVINLLVNAAQAIPEGGGNTHVVGVRLADEGTDVVLEVSDTGEGIAEEHLPRLFDPFFTTRGPEKGTGLGLAIVHRNVSAVKGLVEVESLRGKGTTFRVRLPGADYVTEEVRQAKPVEPRRKATVLVVDDDEMAARAMARVLREHEVAVELSGEGALEALKAGPLPDVVLCDIMMPGLSGIDVFERLKAMRPEAAERVVFITGGVIGDRAERFVTGGGHRVIRKPINAEALRELVATATL